MKLSWLFNHNIFWSFAEKTFVKQSMMLCAFEILLKIGRFEGGVNCTWRFEGKIFPGDFGGG